MLFFAIIVIIKTVFSIALYRPGDELLTRNPFFLLFFFQQYKKQVSIVSGKRPPPLHNTPYI